MSVESRLRRIEREIDKQPDGRIKPTLAEFLADRPEPGRNRTDEGCGQALGKARGVFEETDNLTELNEDERFE